ncbi:MAG TPA: GNAT family N-acetyltransferase [Parafilimonas sp.]|nr:GNAT family N-acetyltransferase [Parafilimonas sp.]
MNINWYCKAFNNLAPAELYQVMRLRSEVFVVEQNCVFLDADNKDEQCLHFMGWIEKDLVAYTRIAPPGYIYEEPSIGRVVTSPAYRKNKIGYVLMEKSIEQCKKVFGDAPIKIGAQYYLKNFYASFGFKQISDIYLEDGIEHIYMLLD